jgi:hypothetical protein
VNRATGQVDQAQIVGNRHPDTDQPRDRDACGLQQRLKGLVVQSPDPVRQGEDLIIRSSGPDYAVEVCHHQRHVIAVDMNPDGVTGVGIDHHARRRLAPRASGLTGRQHQPLTDQSPGDVGDRGRRQARDPGQIHARQRSFQPDGMQNDPLVVVRRPLRIGRRQREQVLVRLGDTPPLFTSDPFEAIRHPSGFGQPQRNLTHIHPHR